MPLKGSRPVGSGAAAIAWAAVVLLIALLGAGASLRLSMAALVGGAYRADPFARRFVDRVSPSSVPEGGVD